MSKPLDRATTSPIRWVTIVPVAIRPKSKGERRALAIASDENPDHVAATRWATLIALACAVLLVVSQLLGCGTVGGNIAAQVADVSAQTWLAARGVPCLDAPPAPKVETTRPPTVGEVLAVLAWAAEIQRQASDVQRAGAEELAAQAAKAVALPPTHAPSTPYREALAPPAP